MKTIGPSMFILWFILAACGQVEVPIAAPFAPSLTEDNLVGKVRKVVTEPLLLDGKATSEGSFFLIEVYSPEGFARHVGYAKKVGSDMVEQSGLERTLDKAGRLLATRAGDKTVNYRYEKLEDGVRAVPVDTSGKAIETESYFEQKPVGDNVTVTESTRDDGIVSVRTYSKTGELLALVQYDSYSGTKTETHYRGGTTQSEQVTNTGSKQKSRDISSQYIYGDGHLPQRILRSENGTLAATEDYEYKVDAAGNWTEYSMYRTEPGKDRVLFAHERRVIEYYP